MLKLSICISTYCRAAFLGETLDSIIPQLGPEVELLIVDGASPDRTPDVMAEYLSRHPQIRYFREQDNSGVDGDYDKAVGYAHGEFCWLMTDDDLLQPDAIARVLLALDGGTDLLVVNAQVKNADLSQILQERRLDLSGERQFSGSEQEQMFVLAGNFLSFIGCVVIRKRLWLARDREKYFGSLYVHFGVIFQAPWTGVAKIICEPLIVLRYGNAMWSGRTFEVWGFKWPKLVWSFAQFSSQARQAVTAEEPWQRIALLLRHRATGAYTIKEYQKYLSPRMNGIRRSMAHLLAVVPASWVNTFLIIIFCILGLSSRMGMFDLLRSPNATAVGRLCARTTRRYRNLVSM